MSILDGKTRVVDGTGDAEVIDTAFTDENGDVIVSSDDNNVAGNGGDDTITTGAGNDTIDGGTGNDTITTGAGQNTVSGNVGDDIITGGSDADVILGDNSGENLLNDTNAATSFAQYGENDAWTVADAGPGYKEMSQTVNTVAGETYELSFDLSANFGSGTVSGAVEVLMDGVVIGSFDTNSAEFSAESLSFIGTGGTGTLTFREIESTAVPTGPTIMTDQPIAYYEKTMTIDGQSVTVDAFAPGQALIYQTIAGTLYAFDPEAETYTKAGADAPFNINGIGFNVEDDLIYGQARGTGTDATGNAVSKDDLVMIDASGNVYGLGALPYGSYTGDMDSNGNLWLFQGYMDRVTKIDVDQFDANGDPVVTTYKFDKAFNGDQFADVAYDPTTNSFFGIASRKANGAEGRIVKIDLDSLDDGGNPVMTEYPITQSIIDGVTLAGGVGGTFGAATVDRDGNLYVGLNQGDHDRDASTSSQTGAIYKVIFNSNGEVTMELLAEAPKTYSNDGAMDTRAIDPFTPVDREAGVLIKSPELKPKDNPNDAITYDDTITAGSGQDQVDGGLGVDLIVGEGRGDTLHGGEGNDNVYGGAGPNWVDNGLKSVYDEFGNRFDQYGNPLPENDDFIFGEAGDDFLHGSAGHDTIDGGVGNDTIEGGTGFDTIYGGEGDDVINSGSDHDTVHGGAGNDDIQGRNGDDVLNGNEGDDTINGGSDNDTIDGGAGVDNLIGGSGDDTVRGGAGNDKVAGGSGNDQLFGDDGRDYLSGYHGDDVMDGGKDKDKLYGGKGADTFTGGEGSDLFVFKSSDNDGSTDTITDFARQSGDWDRIDLRSFNVADGQAWKASNMSYNATDGVVIDLGGGTEIHVTDHDGIGSSFVDTVFDGILL